MTARIRAPRSLAREYERLRLPRNAREADGKLASSGSLRCPPGVCGLSGMTLSRDHVLQLAICAEPTGVVVVALGCALGAVGQDQGDVVGLFWRVGGDVGGHNVAEQVRVDLNPKHR